VAELALNRDVAPHHLAEAFADREAKAGTAVFAGRRGIGLGKFLEQLADQLSRHADAGVAHGNRDSIAVIEPLRLRSNADGPVFRELVGIAREIEQRLAKPGLVGVNRAEVRPTIDDYTVAVLRRHRLDGLGHVPDQRHQREGFEVKLHRRSMWPQSRYRGRQ
jgi:hypothetical protein